MRLFIAIQLSDNMKSALVSTQDFMRRNGLHGNYTRPENLHLTLAFIGDYPDPDEILDVMETVPFEPFRLRLDGVGSFQALWWAGLEKNDSLSTYVKRLRRALAEASVPFDKKRFSPHITLVRKPSGNLHEITERPGFHAPGGSMTVERISLIRSDRGKHGMIYTEVGYVN